MKTTVKKPAKVSFTNRPFQRAISGGAAVTALITLLLSVLTDFTPLFSYIIAINVAAFASMIFDKSAAMRGQTRIPELVFGLWALLGGCLGIVFAMYSARHKTQKARFQLIFGVAIIVQIFCLYQLKEIFSLASLKDQIFVQHR